MTKRIVGGLVICLLIYMLPSTFTVSANYATKPTFYLSMKREVAKISEEEYIASVVEQRKIAEQKRIEEENKYITQNVILTNYYTGDSTGSGTGTSSGLNSSNFQINELGWYTYQDKIVVAAATYVCLYAKTGPCARYKSLPSGYNIYNLYEEIIIVYNGVEYNGIVVDSCGASFWKDKSHPVQTYDIFVATVSGRFGKVAGKVKYLRK